MAGTTKTNSVGGNQQCVLVNVNGKLFSVPFVKLTSTEPESVLTRMVRENWKPSAGRREVAIERNPDLFQFIVGYFNEGVASRWPHDQTIIKQLIKEAEFFQLHGMVPILWRLLNRVPLVTLKLEVGFKVRWNPGTLNLYWHTVAVLTYCYASRKSHFQVVGIVRSKYQLKDSSWWCFDVVCPACAGFDFAPMEDLVDFHAVETVMKHKMEIARGVVRKICQNQCALVDWDVGWRFHMPLSALLQESMITP